MGNTIGLGNAKLFSKVPVLNTEYAKAIWHFFKSPSASTILLQNASTKYQLTFEVPMPITSGLFLRAEKFFSFRYVHRRQSGRGKGAAPPWL